MFKIVKSVEIQASPNTIWTMIAKHLEYPEQREESDADSSSIRPLGGVPLTKERAGVGVRTRWSYKFRGKCFTWDDEVTEWEDEKLIVWKSISKWTMVDSFELTPADNGTTVVYRMQYKFPYGPVGWLVAKLFYHQPIEQSLEKTLQNLKHSAEKISTLQTKSLQKFR